MNHHYALILAGGSGTRFWPLSRNEKPKQLLEFDAKGSMLQQAIARMKELIPAERIIILTNQIQLKEVVRQAPEIPLDNIIAEPARRDTAPAVALGIALIAKRDAEASMIIVPSDSLILNDKAFQELGNEALQLADREPALITLGIKPTWACPSYGYVECGDQLADEQLRFTCREVRRFREKPDSATAQQYLEQGHFLWNAGIFIWKVSHVRHELQANTPQLADFIDRYAQCENEAQFITEEFPLLTPISIDFALMEKAQRVLNFEANFDWDDVGSWISLSKYLPQDEALNACNSTSSCLDASGNIAYSAQGKHIALLGVHDLILVDTADAILVTTKDKADDIKKLGGILPLELQ